MLDAMVKNSRSDSDSHIEEILLEMVPMLPPTILTPSK